MSTACYFSSSLAPVVPGLLAGQERSSIRPSATHDGHHRDIQHWLNLRENLIRYCAICLSRSVQSFLKLKPEIKGSQFELPNKTDKKLCQYCITQGLDECPANDGGTTLGSYAQAPRTAQDGRCSAGIEAETEKNAW
jgi:hypothetical protein